MKKSAIDIRVIGLNVSLTWRDEFATDNQVWQIQENQTVRLSVRSAGCRVSCLAGMLWLTYENNGRDHLLKKNDTLVIDKSGLTVMWAVEASTIGISVRRADSRWQPCLFGQRIKTALARYHNSLQF